MKPNKIPPTKKANSIHNLFYDTRQGLQNAKALYEKAQELGIDMSRKDVQSYYDKQLVNQLMKPVRKPSQFNSVVASYPNNIWQMDIIVYDRYEYHKYKYILVIIDIYSRYLDARAMTNRNIETIIMKLDSMINESEHPDKIECDNEFNKKTFIDYLKKNDIDYYFSDPHEQHKNAIVERVNGTIARLLQKVRLTTNRYDWYNYLEDIVYNYNNTIHSTTKHKPIDILAGKASNMQKVITVENPFKVGDRVRIINKIKLFDKGDVIKASEKIFNVESVEHTYVKLEGIEQTYKPYELTKVNGLVLTNRKNMRAPKTETKRIQTERLRKRIDAIPENIIEGKRERKKKVDSDYVY